MPAASVCNWQSPPSFGPDWEPMDEGGGGPIKTTSNGFHTDHSHLLKNCMDSNVIGTNFKKNT